MTDQARGQAFLEELSGIRDELPFDPTLLRDLCAMTNEKSLAPMDKIAQAIQRDQSLTTRVLALANSAFYGLQAEVTSVARAVTLLGLKEIRNLVLVVGIQAIIQGRQIRGRMDLEGYWRHQLQTAQAAKVLAQKMGLEPDLMFTAGLLHDLGKLLVALYRPEDWKMILEKAEAKQSPYPPIEDAHWGLEHGVIGAMALNYWNLPDILTEPVNWHHAPSLAPEHPDEALCVCLADALAHHLQDPEFPQYSDFVALLEGAGLSLEDLQPELEAALADDDLLQFARQLS